MSSIGGFCLLLYFNLSFLLVLRIIIFHPYLVFIFVVLAFIYYLLLNFYVTSLKSSFFLFQSLFFLYPTYLSLTIHSSIDYYCYISNNFKPQSTSLFFTALRCSPVYLTCCTAFATHACILTHTPSTPRSLGGFTGCATLPYPTPQLHNNPERSKRV